MSRQYFGTDGIRGEVGIYPITPEFVMKLGWAAGKVFSTSCLAKTNKLVFELNCTGTPKNWSNGSLEEGCARFSMTALGVRDAPMLILHIL